MKCDYCGQPLKKSGYYESKKLGIILCVTCFMDIWKELNPIKSETLRHTALKNYFQKQT